MSRKLKIWYCRHSQAEKSKMKSTTAETLRGLLDYDPNTGIFRWMVQPNNRVKVGAVAGSVSSKGYTRIKINGMEFKAHRLAWLHFHGVMPTHDIDHINGNRADNRIANLRDVSRSMNLQNQTRPRTDNTSGYRGVSLHKSGKRWKAQIMVNGRKQYIGYFNTPEAAHAAYLAAKLRFHPGDIRNLAGFPS
jgi:hypothetical protein